MDGARNLSGNTFSDVDNLFLQEISKTDPVHDKKRILQFKGPIVHESFCWILNNDDYNKWRNTKKSGVFWIKGNPGKGKTMLLCGLIEELEKDPETRASLAYFFCQATDSRLNLAVAIIGGLVFSFLRDNKSRLSDTVIQDSGLEHPLVVVDALDECQSGRDLLLGLMVKTSCQVRWLISSRNVKDIEWRLCGIGLPRRLSLELKENADHVSQAVDAYIDSRVQDIEALKDDEELQAETLKVLKSKAKGTFLWVALVIEQLRETDHHNVHDVLEEIPEGLESLYGLIMRQMNERLREKDKNACQVLLSIVTSAERPLHLEELLVFVSRQWKQFKSTYRARDMHDIARDCGSFLSVRDSIVYFVHQSAKDYMVQNVASTIFPAGIEHQHHQMLESSLHAMSIVLKHDVYNLKAPGKHIDSISPPVPDPLAPLRYCCVFWVEHLVHFCQSEGLESRKALEENEIVHSFLRQKYLCWLEAMALLRNVPQAVAAVQALKNLTTYLQAMSDKDPPSKLNHAAYQFLLYCKASVVDYPLQLYYAAMAFQNKHRTLRTEFDDVLLQDLGPRPEVISMPQSQNSLVQTIKPSYFFDPFSDHLFFSPDSACIGSLSRRDHLVEIWQANTGNLLWTIGVEPSTLITFSQDSRCLISAFENGCVEAWSSDNGHCMKKTVLNFGSDLDSHSDSHSDSYSEIVIGLSSYRNRVASIRHIAHEAVVSIWNADMGDCELTFTDGRGGDDSPLAVLSPNSEFLALAYSNRIGIYNPNTGQRVQDLDFCWCDRPWGEKFDESHQQFTFSPNSKFFVTHDEQRKMFLWSSSTWTRLNGVEEAMQDGDVFHVIFSPDSLLLVGATTPYRARVWSTETGKNAGEIPFVFDMAFSPDWTESRLMAVVAQDNDQASYDSRYVVSHHLNHNTFGIWCAERGKCVRLIKHSSGKRKTYSPRAFSPNSTYLAISEQEIEGYINIWRVDTGDCVCVLEEKNYKGYVCSMAFSFDERFVISGYRDGYVRIWDVNSGAQLQKYRGHTDSAGSNWTEAVLPGQLVSIRYESLGRSPNIYHSRTVGSNADTGKRFRTLKGRQSSVIQTVFSSDSSVLASLASPNDANKYHEVRIWLVDTSTCLGRINVGSSRQFWFNSPWNEITTSRFAFRKTSSWEHCEKLARSGYGYDVFKNEAWIYLDGDKEFCIPPEYRAEFTGFSYSDISDSLLAIACRSEKVVIIKFPPRERSEQQAVGLIDSDHLSNKRRMS
ncbi:Vegetative incompatibility HET-E-1-like protein [Cladobotryum mycophilum]|uniref:Vegetative incompatibility HET-E-1-like protein n=1 Tax=Cladobotryum mycophilum TaxID=491253 RepID=A0ABR0T1L1_9HYPO